MRRGYLVRSITDALPAELLSSAADKSGTLRGFQRHRFVDNVLAQPGEHDLTTTVNWSFVKTVGESGGLEFVELVQQDRFLLAKGLLDHLGIEAARANDEPERLQLSTNAREMILPEGMAAHFQVLVQKKK